MGKAIYSEIEKQELNNIDNLFKENEGCNSLIKKVVVKKVVVKKKKEDDMHINDIFKNKKKKTNKIIIINDDDCDNEMINVDMSSERNYNDDEIQIIKKLDDFQHTIHIEEEEEQIKEHQIERYHKWIKIIYCALLILGVYMILFLIIVFQIKI